MTAQDNLSPQQFTTLYHGTSPENAESIAKTGFKAATGHIYPAKWPTLTESKQAGEAYSNGAMVELHVPQNDFWEHSGSAGKLWPAQDHMGGNAYAVKDDLPADYVARVHPVKDKPPYPD